MQIFKLKDHCWKTEEGNRVFGFGGVQQMILDVQLFLRICGKYVSSKATENASIICERGLRAYFAQDSVISGELRLGDWYEERVNAIVEQISDLYVGLH